MAPLRFIFAYFLYLWLFYSVPPSFWYKYSVNEASILLHKRQSMNRRVWQTTFKWVETFFVPIGNKSWWIVCCTSLLALYIHEHGGNNVDTCRTMISIWQLFCINWKKGFWEGDKYMSNKTMKQPGNEDHWLKYWLEMFMDKPCRMNK